MKLSEAIRLGAMLGPQLRGRLTSRKENGSCALGSALLATGKARTYNAVKKRWPWIMDYASCPRCMSFNCRINAVITHLNDSHEWTRERIADWVATIEAQQECIGHPAKTNTEDAALVSGAGQ